MPLITEAIDAGLFAVSAATRQFFLAWRDALAGRDYTPMEDRPGAADAIEEMRALFADGFSCQEFKDRLYAMGAFGCARSRRLKAIAALLGLTDKEVEDCLAEPRAEPGPKVYYLPPEPGGIAPVGITPRPKDIPFFCRVSAEPPPDDTAEGICLTDSGGGCNEPDGEDTDDLPDPDDCQDAVNMLRAIKDLFPVLPPGSLIDRPDLAGDITEASALPQIPDQFPTQEEEDGVIEVPPSITGAFPLYSPRTYLDALYAAINIHDHPKFSKCDQVQDDAEELIETINNTIISLPKGYINPDLLPKGYDSPDVTVKQRPPKIRIGLSVAAGTRANRAAASARRRRAIQMEA